MGDTFSKSAANEEETDGKKYQELPICYSPNYNISFLGLENLHPFDSKLNKLKFT